MRGVPKLNDRLYDSCIGVLTNPHELNICFYVNLLFYNKLFIICIEEVDRSLFRKENTAITYLAAGLYAKTAFSFGRHQLMGHFLTILRNILDFGILYLRGSCTQPNNFQLSVFIGRICKNTILDVLLIIFTICTS